MGEWMKNRKEMGVLESPTNTGSIRDPPQFREEDFEVADRKQNHAEQTRQTECRAERSESWRKRIRIEQKEQNQKRKSC